MSEEETRGLVRRRSAGFCEARVGPVCGGRAESMHHLRKRSHGGGWEPANVVHVCGHGTAGCHGWIEGHPSEAKALGLTRHAGDGLLTPVRLSFRGLTATWVLHNDGTITWVRD